MAARPIGVLLAVWLGAACGTGGGEPAGAAADGSDGGTGSMAPAGQSPGSYRGLVLEPGPPPDFTLTDTQGERFNFRSETADKLALLFFGYTNCPDICPVHMAGIAAVLRDLPWQTRDRIRVVFVSTDPQRDTPERLREWLAGFDPDFVGLRGTVDEVNDIQTALGLPASVRLLRPGDDQDDYEVGHAAHVLVFGSGGLRLAYPFGTRQADWKQDLPALAAELPAPESAEPPDPADAPAASAGRH